MRMLSSLIALLVAVSADPARASNPPPLVVQVIDAASVSAAVMSVAEHTVTQAFRAAGIRALWREDARPEMSPAGHHVTVVILSKDMSRRKAAFDATPDNALGTAAPAARRAWIFIDRIQDVASLQRASLGTLLGIVIAHEVAHVAADIAHSRNGIMEPRLRVAGNHLRGFSPPEAEQLRSALRVTHHSPTPPAILAVDVLSETTRTGWPPRGLRLAAAQAWLITDRNMMSR